MTSRLWLTIWDFEGTDEHHPCLHRTDDEAHEAAKADLLAHGVHPEDLVGTSGAGDCHVVWHNRGGTHFVRVYRVSLPESSTRETKRGRR